MSNFLPDQIAQALRRGLECGALQPIPTAEVVLPTPTMDFVVRIACNLVRKHQEKHSADPVNPFLPYDPELFVTDLSPTHLCLLNKFNVLDQHVLIVTRQFEHQETLLTDKDFDAWWNCLTEFDGLGFYNSGSAAGASQPHKHMQLVGFPLARQGPSLPIEKLIPEETAQLQHGRLSGFPPAHRWAPLKLPPARGSAAAHLHSLYVRLLDELSLAPRTPETRPSGAYNLLLTRTWMMVVPRTQEHFQDVSLNALAFAGSFFVRNQAELELIEKAGPWTALDAVTS